jgi:hypothetical protein
MMDTQNPTNKPATEEIIDNCPTATTTTTAGYTLNSTSITTTGPTTITTMLDLTAGPVPTTTTSIAITGVTTISTNTNPFPTVDSILKKRILPNPIVNVRRWIVLRILVQTKSRFIFM